MSNPGLTHCPLPLDSFQYTLSYNDQFVDMSAPEVSPSHIHNCAEIYLNVEGDVSFLVKNSIYPVEHGDIILTNTNDLHHCIYHSSCVHKHFCLWFTASDSFLSPFFKQINRHRLVFSAEEKSELIRLFYELHEALSAEDQLLSTSCLLQIFTLLRQQSLQKVPMHRETLPEEFQEILDYINENYACLTNACALTDRFFISLSTLNRRFAAYLNITPKAYLEDVKLSNAMRMLDEGKTVTQTCADCGYADCSHFIRNFKKKFGITPYRYKTKEKVQ